MDVLLINTPANANIPERQEPLGIMTLAEVLRKAGHRVMLWDIATEPRNVNRLLTLVAMSSFGAIGISSRTSSYPYARRLGELLRNEAGFKGLLISGGQHVTALPEECVRETADQNVVAAIGEAENLLPEALRAYDGTNGSLEAVKGLAFMDGERYVNTGFHALEVDIDKIPFPKRDNLNLQNYFFYNILSSRGCPYKCIYCQKNITRSLCRKRHPEDVADEIVSCYNIAPNKIFFFVDDFFTIDKKRVFEIFDMLDRKNIHIRWQALSRVNVVDKPLMRELKRLGCQAITYGTESCDPETLKIIRKGHTVKQIKTAVKAASAADVRVKANFMFGFPWDSEESLMRTVNTAAKLPVNGLYAFFNVTPFPGTQLWEILKNENLFAGGQNDWARYDPDREIHMMNENLSREYLDTFRYRAAVTIVRKKGFRELFTGRFLKTVVKRIFLLTTDRVFTAAWRDMMQTVFIERKRLGYTKGRVIRDLLFGLGRPKLARSTKDWNEIVKRNPPPRQNLPGAGQ